MNPKLTEKGVIIRASDVERFRKKSYVNGDCRVWMGASTWDGYGKFFVNGRCELAHRVAWVIKNGCIPNGMCVCHTCDNPPCVNPDHLFLGTIKDNSDDRDAKGRTPPRTSGEKNGSSKLTNGEVIEIRKLRSEKKMTYAKLAKEFGMSRSMIGSIIKRKKWTHI